MSGSNRGKLSKTGLILVAVAVAVLPATAFIQWGRFQSAEYERQANTYSRHYAKNTGKQIREACLGLALVDQKNCTAEAAVKQSEYEHNQRDLVAQRQSALWAYVMAVAAVIGMGFSVIGVFLVWTTFRETKESNTIARDTAKAAEREAQAARDALILAERAIIRLITVRVSVYKPQKWWEAQFRIVNSGQSNAHQFVIEYALCPKPIFPDGLYHVQRISKIVPRDTDIDLPEFAMPAPTEFPSYLVGSIRYSTIHEATFETNFCLEILAPPTQNGLGEIENSTLKSVFCPSLPPDT